MCTQNIKFSVILLEYSELGAYSEKSECGAINVDTLW